MFEVPESRLRHCYVVGKVMEYCARRAGFGEETQKRAYLVGYLHDSMFDYETEEKSHSDVISECLNFYSEELRNHTKFNGIYKSYMQNWLYFADHIVDSNGNVVSFDERLLDIIEQHGKDDGVYLESKNIVNMLKCSGFSLLERDCIKYFNNNSGNMVS